MSQQTVTIDSTATDTNLAHLKPEDLKPVQLSLQNLNWGPFLFITGVHIIALAGAFFTFSWQALMLCLVLHWVTGGVGITLTYHRLLTHKSFSVPKWLEYTLVVMASLACQGGPISWVGAHRLHHAKSDTDGDPHSPRNGFFWSHMGWCVTKNRVVDDYATYSRFAPDLAKDPVHRFLNQWHIVWNIPLGIGLYLWGGLPFVIWGIFVRIALVYHCTWLVNSAAHVWGYKTYDSRDDSRNLWWVALLTYGEGWHNNHHAFQHSARHGLGWWEVDTTYFLIQLLERLGLAKAVQLPSSELLLRKETPRGV